MKRVIIGLCLTLILGACDQDQDQDSPLPQRDPNPPGNVPATSSTQPAPPSSPQSALPPADETPKNEPSTQLDSAAQQITTETLHAVDSAKQALATQLKAFNEKCPISGDPVTEEGGLFTFEGKTFGFCCPDCIDTFKKAPEKYAAALTQEMNKLTNDAKTLMTK